MSVTPTLTEAAGPSATACGSVGLGRDRTAVDACAVAAQRANRPFWFAIQQQGVDSEVWSAVVLTSDGTGYSFLYDGDPSGGSQIGARIERSRCSELRVVTVDGREQVQCYAGTPLGAVCGS